MMHSADFEPGDLDLVRSASVGDRLAFGELYRRYARMIHGILLARVPVRDAEDLVHDVFVSALKQLPLLRKHEAFRGWLASIARNRAVDYHRDSRSRTEAEVDVEEAARSSNGRPNHSSNSAAEALMVLEAIRALPEAYRETLILRLVEGMTGPEIAAQTGLKHDSVRVNLCRGMKILREALKCSTVK